MRRYLISTLGAVVVIGSIASLAAAPKEESTQSSPLAGKAVIVQMSGVYYGVKENVRFESIGGDSFIVIPSTDGKSGKMYEQWWPMEVVSGLKVFDSREDALAHDKKTSPFHSQDAVGDTESK